MLQVKVPAHQLAKGMYVSNLDRPWVETPFMFQGFLIEEERQIRKLQQYCQHVFIDVEKGISPPPQAPGGAPSAEDLPAAPIPRPRVRYEVKTSVEDELRIAKETHAVVVEVVGAFLDDVRAGKKPDLDNVKKTVVKMEQSILRNPDAFMWLRRLKKRDSYTYNHCIDCSILAIAFGRQLGLPPTQIRDLGIGALLFDVGKMRVSPELLGKAGPLTPAEYREVQRHVEYSLQIMDEMRDVPPNAVVIAATHHERFDGSGYPKGLRGGEIPLLGRMAAIVDFFDAVTSDRPHCGAISPHDAIKSLYQLRNTSFQDELIEHFIQTLGVYPVGTTVELSNGEVGIVIGQNPVRRLRPTLVMVLDREKKPLDITPVRDLLSETHDQDGRELSISRSLEPGAYGLDPDEFYL